MVEVGFTPCQEVPEMSAKSSVQLLCGALGTALQKQSEQARFSEELLETNPLAVTELHRTYALSHAKILLTHTFGIPRLLFENKITLNHAKLLIEKSILCLQAASQRTQIALSFGPASAHDEGTHIYKKIVTLTQNFPHDFLFFETLTSLKQAESILTTCSPCDKPLVLSFSPNLRGQLRDGTILSLLSNQKIKQIHSLGINCVEPREEFSELIHILHSKSHKPIWFRPSAGTTRWLTPEIWAKKILPTIKFAAAVGGCCGTTPAHIKCLAKMLGGPLKK